MRHPLTTRIGKYLFELRGRSTIEDFVKRTGISRATWSRVERGYAPTLLTLVKIHARFGLPWDVLMTYYLEDFPPAPEDEESEEEEPCHVAS